MTLLHNIFIQLPIQIRGTLQSSTKMRAFNTSLHHYFSLILFLPIVGVLGIISGNVSQPGYFPWHVALKYDDEDGLYFCGGSLISTKWVLTAAHCTDNVTTVYMIFGATNLNNYSINRSSNHFIIHPDFHRVLLTNDVSLIKFSPNIVYTSTIKPIKLLSNGINFSAFVGIEATVLGFGYTSDEDLIFSKDLMYTNMLIIDNKICSDIYVKHAITPITVCAKGALGTNQNICNGDSGGGMVLKYNGEFYLVAITSFILKKYTCTLNNPSGFLRIDTNIINFINIHTSDYKYSVYYDQKVGLYNDYIVIIIVFIAIVLLAVLGYIVFNNYRQKQKCQSAYADIQTHISVPLIHI